MSEVKWIKLVTGFFDDEKIKLIEAMPEADMVLVIWIKLLTLAGKKNMNGYIFLTSNIPYTDEMFSTLFDRPLNTVRLALSTFKKFGMINYEDDSIIKITNWEKHQNIEGLEKIKEQNRLRVARFREKHKKELEVKKLPLQSPLEELDKKRIDKIRLEGNITCNVTEIIDYLNKKTGKHFLPETIITQRVIKARLKEGRKINAFKWVIDIKTKQWLNTDFDGYLRPETLFGNKFEGYLNEKIIESKEEVNEKIN